MVVQKYYKPSERKTMLAFKTNRRQASDTINYIFWAEKIIGNLYYIALVA